MKNDVNRNNNNVVRDDKKNAVTSDLDVVADAINEVVTNNSSAVTSDEIDKKKLARKKSTLKSQTKRYLLDFCTYKDFLEVFLWIKADARRYHTEINIEETKSSKYNSDEKRKYARTKTTLKSQAKRYILDFCRFTDFQELFDWLQEGLTRWFAEEYYTDCNDERERSCNSHNSAYFEISYSLDIIHNGMDVGMRWEERYVPDKG